MRRRRASHVDPFLYDLPMRARARTIAAQVAHTLLWLPSGGTGRSYIAVATIWGHMSLIHCCGYHLVCINGDDPPCESTQVALMCLMPGDTLVVVVCFHRVDDRRIIHFHAIKRMIPLNSSIFMQ